MKKVGLLAIGFLFLAEVTYADYGVSCIGKGHTIYEGNGEDELELGFLLEFDDDEKLVSITTEHSCFVRGDITDVMQNDASINVSCEFNAVHKDHTDSIYKDFYTLNGKGLLQVDRYSGWFSFGYKYTYMEKLTVDTVKGNCVKRSEKAF